MIPLIWLRGILAMAVLSLVLGLGLGYAGYSKIKQIGYEEAAVKYTQQIANYQSLVDVKITALELSSTKLAELTKANSLTLNSNVLKITRELKGKTLTIVKDGECYPNKTFSDSFKALNSTVNESMQESRK